jgi:hypothetical protein
LSVIVLVSGCVKQEPAAVTTTTTTVAGTANLPTDRLLTWTKDSGVRIASGISSCTIVKGGEYWMYYTARGIELATSTDGLSFTGKGTVVFSGAQGSDQEMVTNPTVFQLEDGGYRMLYEGSTRVDNSQTNRKLYSAVSEDGLAWTKESGVRFYDEGDKPGEIFTSVPDVMRLLDGRLRMYYTRGMTSATAVSSDEGVTWTKERNLGLGEIAVDPDIVRLDDGTYKLFYTAFESEWAVGSQVMMSASSANGLDFVVDSGRRLEPTTPNGLITDPDVVKVAGGYRMYYGEFSSPNSMTSDILSAFSAS